MNNRLFTFAGGNVGPWEVTSQLAVVGEALKNVSRVNLIAGSASILSDWELRGVTSNERYVTRMEKSKLVSIQEGLGRDSSTCAALIPIRKTPEWWALTQEERREIFEGTSTHIQIGLKYLPGVARRLHHCRDIGTKEPFDFLTWFEFAPDLCSAFDELVASLRATEEWNYIDREVDIRLERNPT